MSIYIYVSVAILAQASRFEFFPGFRGEAGMVAGGGLRACDFQAQGGKDKGKGSGNGWVAPPAWQQMDKALQDRMFDLVQKLMKKLKHDHETAAALGIDERGNTHPLIWEELSQADKVNMRSIQLKLETDVLRRAAGKACGADGDAAGDVAEPADKGMAAAHAGVVADRAAAEQNVNKHEPDYIITMKYLE